MARLGAFSGETGIFLVGHAPHHQKQIIFTGQVEQFSSVATTQIEVTYFVVGGENVSTFGDPLSGPDCYLNPTFPLLDSSKAPKYELGKWIHT